MLKTINRPAKARIRGYRGMMPATPVE